MLQDINEKIEDSGLDLQTKRDNRKMKTQTRQFFLGILIFLTIPVVSAYAAEDPFSKFAKDVKKRDQAMLKAVQQIEERWDRFYESTIEDYYVYSKDGRVRRRANFSDESPEKGFLEVAGARLCARALSGRVGW